MNHKHVKILLCGVLAVAVFSVGALIYANRVPDNDFEIPAPAVVERTEPIEVKPIEASKPDIIPEISKEEVETPETVEVQDEATGETVVKRIYETETEVPLAVQPESSAAQPAQPAPSQTAPASSGGSSAQNGDTKVIDGETYGYVEGFGWVKHGGDNVGEVVDAPTTGNQVGY